ncbi:hypothetical protein Sinac_5526 [Singulisphaera acidiphila DSM 18658]|uniref:Uncharacterized protein n=1 Tax=Singulisphaera acidiphila (strain ATCC BAA-1392 / DSM 18658 / VKM B-2454 / MOB10) TaxID=886293 RepID=L0DK85_SINAD|nr:hypothetical protein Sinac_5526 [Singulisphaera acidiphila DSM 18658]
MIEVSLIYRMFMLLKLNESKKAVPFKSRKLQENITG